MFLKAAHQARPFSLPDSRPATCETVSLQLAISALEDTMFADSLLENHWTNHGRRGWTTLASFALQTLGIAILLTLPLIYTEGLPKLHLISMSAPLGPPPGPPPARLHPQTSNPAQSNFVRGILVAPSSFPSSVHEIVDNSTPDDPPPCAICVPGGTGECRTRILSFALSVPRLVLCRPRRSPSRILRAFPT